MQQPATAPAPPCTGDPAASAAVEATPSASGSQPDSGVPASASAGSGADAAQDRRQGRGHSFTRAADGADASRGAGAPRGAPPGMVAAIQAAAASLQDPEGPRGADRTAALLLASARGDGGEPAPLAEAQDLGSGEELPDPAASYVRIPQDEQVRLRLLLCCHSGHGCSANIRCPSASTRGAYLDLAMKACADGKESLEEATGMILTCHSWLHVYVTSPFLSYSRSDGD